MEVKWPQVSVQKNTGVKVPSVSHVSQRASSWRLEKRVEQPRDSFKIKRTTSRSQLQI